MELYIQVMVYPTAALTAITLVEHIFSCLWCIFRHTSHNFYMIIYLLYKQNKLFI